MAADVQPVAAGGHLRRMAEPEPAPPLGGLPPQAGQGTLAVVVPLDPGHRTGQVRQGVLQLLLKGGGDSPGMVHEIPEDEIGRAHV